MDLILEFTVGLFFEFLGSITESDATPKWVRYSVLGAIVAGLLTLIILGIIHATEGIAIFLLVLLGIGLLALYGYFVRNIWHSGILRPAKQENLPEILKMYRSVIEKPGCNWSISYPNEATLHEDFSTGNLYVLWRGKKMIGAGSIVPKNELDDLDVWQHREKVGEIARIVIKPEYQSKGYGKHLVKKLCYKLDNKGHTAVHLLVSTENHHALNLYREVGFHCMGQCERYDHTYYAFEKKL